MIQLCGCQKIAEPNNDNYYVLDVNVPPCGQNTNYFS